MGYVCEDRKKEGLFLKQDVQFNTSINVLERFLKNGVYKKKTESKLTENYADMLQTKITGTDQTVGNLSGGNQQKVLISRWRCV